MREQVQMRSCEMQDVFIKMAMAQGQGYAHRAYLRTSLRPGRRAAKGTQMRLMKKKLQLLINDNNNTRNCVFVATWR